jgi:LmbE family N-acetylglucosaminyl deacetylase
MITPLVSEREWMESLPTLPLWQPARRPTIVISPHPDDETLGVGGLIAALRSQDIEVTVVAVTDGENAYSDCPALGLIREEEQSRALQQLGVNCEHIIRLRLPDSGLAQCEPMFTDILDSLVRPGSQIFSPWKFDFHPDHETCGRVAELISDRKDIHLIYYFFWSWHRKLQPDLEELDLVQFPLTPKLLREKLSALECHASQLSRDGMEPILPDELLGPARRPFEVLLPA